MSKASLKKLTTSNQKANRVLLDKAIRNSVYTKSDSNEKKISDFVGKQFIHLYSEFYNS